MLAQVRSPEGGPAWNPVNDQLEGSSTGKVHDLVSCNDFGHDACGRAFSYWFNVAGYATRCGGYAENLAFGTGSNASARAVMRGWLDSAPHRGDLLGRRYRHIGVGLESGYWVAHYGYHC